MSESATFHNSSPVLNSTAPNSATIPVTATSCESVTHPDKAPLTHDSMKHDKTPMTVTPCVSTVESAKTPPTLESTKRVSGARVLTSARCARRMREKEKDRDGRKEQAKNGK